jgi:hypothetical protein
MDKVAWLLANWDVLTLLVTNIGALFVKPPGSKKREKLNQIQEK